MYSKPNYEGMSACLTYYVFNNRRDLCWSGYYNTIPNMPRKMARSARKGCTDQEEREQAAGHL